MDLLRKIVLIGGSGQLGTEVLRTFKDCDIAAPERSLVDVEENASITAMFKRFRPTLVINTSAYHHVEMCENHPDRAFAVNALAVDSLAGACTVAGSAFATVSTDYVFGGDSPNPYGEGDEPRPINAYGASKLAGEHLTRRHGERYFIFRTSGLYGRAGSSNKGYTFIERVLGQVDRGEPVRVVDNMRFSPSYAVHVAQAIRRIVETEKFGTYHVTNSGSCSWYEFAEEAFRQAGLRANLSPIKYEAYDTFVKRPLNSALAHDALRAAGIEDLPDWRTGLAEYLAARSEK